MINPLWRVEFLYHVGGFTLVNTLHVWESGAGPFTQTAQNVADAVNTDLQATFRNMLDDVYTLDEIKATKVKDPYGVGVVPAPGSHPIGVLGARASANHDLPNRICTMISWRTDSGGRRARGRFFCPPLEASTSIAADLIGSGTAYGLAVAAFAADVVDQGLGSSLEYVVYSPTQHRLGLTPFVFKITGYVWPRKLAYLSSRDD
jgi:hypothetical protein